MKKKIVPKTTLILLLFTLLLAWSAVLPGRADSLIKSKEFTTRTFYADGDDDEVEFTENFGFAGDSYLNSGRFRMDITLTPVYNSIWISSDGERANLATEPAIVNLINSRLNARIDTATGGEFQSDYGSDGMIRSFRYSRSDLLSEDLTYANFTVTLPDEYAIESLFYQYGEDLEIDDVQYSVKFNVKVSIYGNAPGIKLKKKVLYGYINDIWYFIDVAELKGGNEKIVKATSSNPSVAVVSASTQRIRLKKVGTSKITLTNGYGRSATFTVKVQSSSIKRRVSSVSCILGTEMDLDNNGIVGILGTPRYTVKSSDSSIVSVRKSLNHPIIRGKKTGSARISFTCGKKKFSVLVRVKKASVVFSNSITLTEGSSRSLSAAGSSSGIYIKKAVSLNGLLSLKLSANSKTLTLTANKSFSGSTATEKVLVTFNNGTKKTVTVKITRKPTPTKPFSLKDIKIKLIRSYWNGSKACIEYSVTNNSSKNLNKVRIFYSGTISETVSGYATINSSIPKGTTKTFITRVSAYDYLEGVTLKVTSAS